MTDFSRRHLGAIAGRHHPPPHVRQRLPQSTLTADTQSGSESPNRQRADRLLAWLTLSTADPAAAQCDETVRHIPGNARDVISLHGALAGLAGSLVLLPFEQANFAAAGNLGHGLQRSSPPAIQLACPPFLSLLVVLQTRSIINPASPLMVLWSCC